MRREKNFASNNNLVYKIFVDSRNNSSIIYQSEEIIQRNSNAIKEIERNIELIKNTETEDIFGLASLIIKEKSTTNSDQKLLEVLGNTKLKLSEANLYFTENDILIKNLKNNLFNQSEQLREILINTLINEKSLLNNQIKAAYINPDIISKHRELLADLDQKKNILSSLTTEKIQISLFNELDRDPWKLITEPTLFPNKIKPSKKIYGAASLIIGFIFGMIISILKEKRSGIIFNPAKVKELLANKVEQIFELKNSYEIEEDLRLLIMNIYKRFPKNIYSLYKWIK